MSNALIWFLILVFCFMFWALFIFSLSFSTFVFSVLVWVSVCVGGYVGTSAGSQEA